MKTFDVVIIGAGTSGLTARREVARQTDNYLVIDDGPLGTTCARVGCMPSKVFIQVANDFHRRKKFSQIGIQGGESLSLDGRQVMSHVRSLRDRFTGGVINAMEGWSDKLMRGRAKFLDSHTVEVNGDTIRSEKFIIATGSSPMILPQWQEFREQLLTTDQIFEMEDLPQSMAVFGLGVIGIELGQALHNLGVDVVGITTNKAIGGLTDPELQNYVAEKFSQEMKIHFNGGQIKGRREDGQLEIVADETTYFVEKAFIAIGRTPNVQGMGLENIGMKLDERGLPGVDSSTMKVQDMPHILFPGDVNNDRPILHEAADEGVIAGHNATFEGECFKRRTPLGITFSEPNIATVGKRYQQLKDEGIEFETGEVSFEGQGRSIVKLKEQGLLHIYADKKNGLLLGAELHGPDGEHLAHLLAWAISFGLTAREALRMPFYHPVVEEGLRTAIRDVAKKVGTLDKELFRCMDPPIR